jgi:hypothetical protein
MDEQHLGWLIFVVIVLAIGAPAFVAGAIMF